MNFPNFNTDSFIRFNVQIQQLTNKLFSPDLQAFKESIQKMLDNNPIAMKATDKLGNEQYVCWERFSNEIAEEIMNTCIIDELLLSLETEGCSPKINTTIEKCSTHYLVEDRKSLFSDIVCAYQSKLYTLVVTGLFSLIDGLLSEATYDNGTSISKRIQLLLDEELKINPEYKGAKEYILLTTLSKTTASISAFSDFDWFEPLNLNRHWFVHGRSTRACSQLDCIKLFNYLYGIMLVFDITNQSN